MAPILEVTGPKTGRPTWPGGATRNWAGATTNGWCSEGPSTASPAAWWAPISPDGPGRRCGVENHTPSDIDGTEVTVAEGKVIMAERYDVPEEVRRRRPTKKAGPSR